MSSQSESIVSGNEAHGQSGALVAVLSLWQRREVVVLAFVASMSLVLALVSPHFLKPGNIRVVTDSISSDLLVTIGEALVLIVGGIDVSVGAIIGASAVAAADLMAHGSSIAVAVLVSMLVALVIGVVNGFIVAYIRVNPFMTTLATNVVVRGMLVAYTKGFLIGDLPRQFNVIGQGSIGPVGIPIIIGLVCLTVFYVLLNNTSFFQQFYFVGGNERAAKVSGVRVERVRFLSYVLCAGLAGLAGIIILSRTMVGTSQIGLNVDTRALIAAVIGGASFVGGEGNLIGPALGVLLLAVITDALVLMGVSAYYQSLATGFILLLTVCLDAILHRKR